jgi:hypothetical protein
MTLLRAVCRTTSLYAQVYYNVVLLLNYARAKHSKNVKSDIYIRQYSVAK